MAAAGPVAAAWIAGVRVAAALAAAACASPDPEGGGGEAPGTPVWRAGDLHVHATGASNDTDDTSFPEDIARVARERGLSWVVLTDHSNSTGSMHCEAAQGGQGPRGDVEDCPNLGPEFPYAGRAAALSDDALLMVDGNELSPAAALGPGGGPTGHVGCLPPATAAGFAGWDGAFTDRPVGTVTSAGALAQCRAAGGFAVLNHPFAPATWVAADWTTTAPADIDGVEVWNGGANWDAWDRMSLRAWECLAIRSVTARERPPTPLAASDNHRVVRPADEADPRHPPLGRPRTSVRTAALAWPAIHAELSAGRVVLHEDDTFLAPDGAGRTPTPGRIEVRRLRMDAAGPDAAGCDATDGQGPALHDVTARFDVAAGEFAVAIPPQEGRYYLALTRDDPPALMGGDVAMTGLLP